MGSAYLAHPFPTAAPAHRADMFKKLFGAPGGGAAGPSATGKTMDAIQKLGEVGWDTYLWACGPCLSTSGPDPRALEVLPPLDLIPSVCLGHLQQEELLGKQRDLLEKKIAAEVQKARECMKRNDKKGESVKWEVVRTRVTGMWRSTDLLGKKLGTNGSFACYCPQSLRAQL